jgi:hypothetical protein
VRVNCLLDELLPKAFNAAGPCAFCFVACDDGASFFREISRYLLTGSGLQRSEASYTASVLACGCIFFCTTLIPRHRSRGITVNHWWGIHIRICYYKSSYMLSIVCTVKLLCSKCPIILAELGDHYLRFKGKGMN